MPTPPDFGSRNIAIVGFNDLEFMAIRRPVADQRAHQPV